MIHETLFYLLNCPSEVQTTHSFENLSDILELQEFVHPCEKKLLQRILSVGCSYHLIEHFVRTVNDQNVIEIITKRETDSIIKYDEKVTTECTIPGLYVKAFCQGVDDCLEDYRKDIVKLEELFLNNSNINLTYILSCVEKYVMLFDSLKSMIFMIQNDKIRGCQIIGKLKKYLDCGSEAVVRAARKIIQSVNVIFFRQLCNWIIYGELLDCNDEFFICDGKDMDENFFNAENAQNEVSRCGNDSFLNSVKRTKLKKPPPIRRFFLKEELFPFDNSNHLAEVILFMGQIVWIVSNGPEEKARDKLNFRQKRDIWEGQDIEYYQKLQKLENVLNIVEFQNVIEECRLKLAKYLWNVMIEEANLLEHLQLIRDYYCLGRGELFQQFIIYAENQLKQSTNINLIFKEVTRKIYGDNDKTHKKFEISVPKNLDKNCSDPWSSVEVNFEVEWPLHIIFHPKTLKLYNKLFCYLLRIKKTHIDLHKVWLSQIKHNRKINPVVLNLRNILMFVVNNIQYYLQVDVIEAQFSILKGSLKNANEFGQITRHHSVFLSNLLSKTFILATEEEVEGRNKELHTLYQTPALVYTEGQNLVYKVILQILQLCDKFCFLSSTWDTEELMEPELKQLEVMKGECDTLMQILLRMLYDLHERVAGPHLLQLLHRLDFNRWFSKRKELSLTSS